MNFSRLSGVLLAFGLVACGQTPSQLATVDLPQTTVKSQGGVGFCWSYATLGLVESTRLPRDGRAFDLSEEAIGFYRIAEELSYLSQHYSASQLSSRERINDLGVEGITGSDFLFHSRQKAFGRFPSALELVKKYGVTPESAWSVKFGRTSDGRGEGTVAINEIIDRFIDYKASHRESTCCDVETLASHVMVAPRGGLGFPSVPPTTFDVDGQAQSPLDLLNTEFDVKDPEAYDVVTATSMADYDEFVQRTKEALVAGETVPVEFSVDGNYMDMDTNTFSGVYSGSGADPRFSLDGGHVVLITDFVNVGGRPGAVSDAEKAQALAASPSDLDYFVVKNSWGTGGTAPNDLAPGYYIIKKRYLELHMAAHTPNQVSTLFVAVPTATH